MYMAKAAERLASAIPTARITVSWAGAIASSSLDSFRFVAQSRGEVDERVVAPRRVHRLVHRLINAWGRFDRLIENGVGAGRVAAHQAQFPGLLVSRDHRAQVPNHFALLRPPRRVRPPRHRRENVDGRISSLVCNGAIQHDMSVEGAANRV